MASLMDDNTLKDAGVASVQDAVKGGGHEHIGSRNWDDQEEARVRRKLDFRLVPVAFLLYLLCFIDR